MPVLAAALLGAAPAAGPRPKRRVPESRPCGRFRCARRRCRRATWSETLSLTGTLDPRAQVTSFPRCRRASSVCCKTKAIAWRGASCSRCWTTPISGWRAIARRHLDVAEANRAHARAEKDRADSLLKTGGITDKDHLAAQVAVQVAEASTAQARSELAIAERQMGAYADHGADRGRIAKRHADAGTIVTAGTPLYTIVDDAVFEFRSSVASGDFGKLKVGETVTVTVDALPGFVTEGKVDRIAPQVDARSRSFEAIIRVPGRPQLVSGLFARARGEGARSARQPDGAAGGAPPRRIRSRRRRRPTSCRTAKSSAAT